MKKESIILNIFPLNKNSLILLDFGELKFPEDIDFGSLKVTDGKNRPIMFELIKKAGYKENLGYLNGIGKNCIAMIIKDNDSKYLRILFNRSSKPTNYTSPKESLVMANGSFLKISAGNSSVSFEKNGYSIEKIQINGKDYGPLQLAASGGSVFFQKDMQNANLEVISDASIAKIIKIKGSFKVYGDKCKSKGILPIEILYYFYSPDGKSLMSKAEIQLKYDEATGLNGSKSGFLDPLVWYRLDNINKKLLANDFFANPMRESKIITLKHPYYAGFKENGSAFAMFPYLALPCDGIHIEQGKDFFGACWHSMSSNGISYWVQIDRKEITGKPQGYYPAHSLRGYWNIGLYFGDSNENIEALASAFSYQPKIRNIIHIGSEPVSNACIARWKDNKKMTFNAITDDAKINDYIYRAEGKIPKWVQMAIATRTLFGISYHRFCFIEDKIFYLPGQKLLSTVLSTLFCGIGLGNPLRKKFESESLSYLLHTNTHPRIYKLGENGVKSQIEKAEDVWINKWKYKTPLSHVFSYASPYGIAAGNGTMEKAAFSASKSLQWIREWPIPNAPLDFFLPTRLFWGICVGEMFDKENCNRIKKEFSKRHENGADYMLIAGHVPDYNNECPKYVAELFGFLQKKYDVWFASSDDIIKYYKARESTIIGRVKKHGTKFLIELENKLPNYFSTEITLIQHVNKKISKIQFRADNKNHDVKYKFIGKNLITYDIPSTAKRVVIS